jgi:aminoglycoside phosphotransferase (APT) family kinase protein
MEQNQRQVYNQAAQAKMHEGEIHIDIDLVRRLLADQFPDLTEKPIRVVQSTGTVNAIFRLGDESYVRLPRLEIWAECIDHEWTWLPKLAPHISLNIPTPLARGKPTNGYPCPWAVYQWIEGFSYQDDLINDERQMAYDLAHFILELRSVDRLAAPRGGRRPLIELDAATRSAIEAARGVIDTEAVSAAWAQSLESPPWDRKPVWIHGDLLKSNLLVRAGRLCAVIDFGGAGIGDPAADVVPAWSVFTNVGRETFRLALDVDDDTWSRARGYALHQALLIIPYYAQSNPDFVTMAKRTVEEVLAELK